MHSRPLFGNTGSGGINIFVYKGKVNIWNVNCTQATALTLTHKRMFLTKYVNNVKVAPVMQKYFLTMCGKLFTYLRVISNCLRRLLYWGWNKLAAISQTMFWNAFSWIKTFEFYFKQHFIEMYSSGSNKQCVFIISDNGLAPKGDNISSELMAV